ncbi:MAG: WG repeat-containing protein [Chlorogloea purpurea SAG 13.99]|jgi:hypothetical protein|nr:WG repeat-containing protein [Chlorogloea purpurea SAG 13.99]
MMIEPFYGYGGKFSEGLAKVKIDNRVGYIDTDGRYVIDLAEISPDIDFAYDFVAGLA